MSKSMGKYISLLSKEAIKNAEKFYAQKSFREVFLVYWSTYAHPFNAKSFEDYKKYTEEMSFGGGTSYLNCFKTFDEIIESEEVKDGDEIFVIFETDGDAKHDNETELNETVKALTKTCNNDYKERFKVQFNVIGFRDHAVNAGKSLLQDITKIGNVEGQFIFIESFQKKSNEDESQDQFHDIEDYYS